MDPSRKFGFADAIRGPAALCVVASHLLGNVTPNWQMPMHLLGQLGVALFFLVSGFVIPISLTKYDVHAFLVARILRIYPTYAVGLTITLAAIWMQGEQQLGNDVLRYASNYLIAGMFFDKPAFDDVVWTLQIELHFYIICALMAPLIRKFRLQALMAPVAIFVGEVGAYYFEIPLAVRLAGEAPFLLFMFGGMSVFYFVNQRINATTMVAYCIGCFFLLAFAWWYGVGRPNAHLSSSYAVAVAIFLAALFWGAGVAGRFFARISYPLYVIHTGVGVYALKMMLWHSYPDYVAVLVGFATSIGVAVIVHEVVEAPTHHLGQRLAHKITYHHAVRAQL
jgi:peptidoglycan/LPS O-acetylase OafA/YrhL